MEGTKVELSDRLNTKGLAVAFMFCRLRPCVAGVSGETGVNELVFGVCGTKFLNSPVMVNCAGLEKFCGISGTNGFPDELPWKPVLTVKGLNCGAKAVELSFAV